MLLFCPVLPNVPTAHKIHHKRYQRRNFQITVFQIKTNLSTIRFICFTQNVLDALDALDQMYWMPQIQSQKLNFFFTELPLALPSLTAPRTVIFTVIKNIKISLFYNKVMFHSHRSLYRTLYFNMQYIFVPSYLQKIHSVQLAFTAIKQT